VTKRTRTKLAASILNQLRKLARERGDDLQLVLLRHVKERLLYRLAKSDYANSFVLKGAALFTLWTGQPHRATRDLDLLGFGEASETHVRDVFKEVLSIVSPKTA
jgi:predicted nucleotidyltransferase component of viral defense system